jgi:hypothetical protein
MMCRRSPLRGSLWQGGSDRRDNAAIRFSWAGRFRWQLIRSRGDRLKSAGWETPNLSATGRTRALVSLSTPVTHWRRRELTHWKAFRVNPTENNTAPIQIVSDSLVRRGLDVRQTQQRFPELSHGEAVAALRWLVARGTIKTKHISDALKRREGLVREIRTRLASLGDDGLQLLKDGPFPLSTRRTAGRKQRRKASPKTRAAWVTQGKYLGAVRRLSAANRAKVKAIRSKSGVRAAITAARKLAKG